MVKCTDIITVVSGGRQFHSIVLYSATLFLLQFQSQWVLAVKMSSTIISTATATPTLSVGSYNLWNVMFNWEVRLQHIADTIRQSNLDIVVFQEVRLRCENTLVMQQQRCSSQLDAVRWLLPEYQWVLAYPAGSVSKRKSSISDDWQFEGLGVISRKPILSSKAVKLRQTSFRDSNKRIALHLKVKVRLGNEDVMDSVDIVVVHFSYDPPQQCDNANDIMELINEAGLKQVIILGDFNAYDETSPAIGQFVGLPSGHMACKKVVGDDYKTVEGNFQDVWVTAGQSHLQGLSFSNMPSPGLQSRPDRILVNKQVEVIDVGLVGNESTYWDHYQPTAISHRARTVLQAAYDSFAGLNGYSCLHDCGPHGSCRCGVCVKGGDDNNCHLPKCSECSGGKFIIFLSLSCIAVILSIILLLSVIRILVVSARFNQEDLMDILGYRCCLLNRQLFHFKFHVLSRRFRMRLVNVLRLYNLPPAVAVLASVIFLCLTLAVIYLLSQDAIATITSVLPEEKFPSDHKMVFARLKVS